jgi:pimeloyl-ACP methyl ester carboxylesterase
MVPLGDGRVPVLELGDPAGPTVVLVPGLSDGLAPITQRRTRELLGTVPLPMERFRCLVLSHRVPVADGATTRSLAAELAVVLARERAGPAVLVCHSMGAMVAQHLAADAPELVAGLVLSATLGRADDRFRDVLARWEALVVAGDGIGFARDAVRSSFTGTEVALRLALVDAAPGVHHRLPPHLIRRHVVLSRACAAHDAVDRLAAIGCPTLVLAGACDEVTPPEHAWRLAARIPDARMHVAPGLGHGFPEQDPDGYARVVTAFLATLHGWTRSTPG